MIKVYTIPNCPFCTQLKELLNEAEIEFDEINVNLVENENEYNQIHKITKSDDVPIIRIKKQLLIPNVSFHTIKEAVDLTKKFLSESDTSSK